MKFPQMLRVRQRIADQRLADIPQAIQSQIDNLPLPDKVRPGQTVAIACSSRGIANYPLIVKSVVEGLKRLELASFLIPAMGSHGAATAAGQKRVLEHLDITEAAVGVPIRSSLEVVTIGKTADGVSVYLDKKAAEADHIVLVNRIKKHTDFEHEFESGLLKMMAIGLGKQAGAAMYHQAMITYGYPRIIFSVAQKLLAHANVLLGVGIVENGRGQTADIGVCVAADIEDTEKKLLQKAKALAPHLPFEAADILIIDEMGKEISGTGFDTKIVGRIGMPLICEDPEKPRIKCIVVSDLTSGSEGNAVGIGNADIITQRLYDKIDRQALNINTITGVCPQHGKIPLTLKNDREALEVAIKCVGLVSPPQLKIIRIKNTAQLEEIEISAAYAEELAARDDLEIIRAERPMEFDPTGNLEKF